MSITTLQDLLDATLRPMDAETWDAYAPLFRAVVASAIAREPAFATAARKEEQADLIEQYAALRVMYPNESRTQSVARLHALNPFSPSIRTLFRWCKE